MTIFTGDDGILDDIFSYQTYNHLKNHWRAGAAPADIQAGMIWADSGDDKLYHHGHVVAIGDEEILQVTRSADISPQFATVRLMDTGGDHYLDLKCNENLGANRLLNLVVGNAARTITLSGSPTLGDWFDQAVKQASNVIFGTIASTAKVTIGTAVTTPSSCFDVRSNNPGEYISTFEQDADTGWGVLIDTDSADGGDPAFNIKNPSGDIFVAYSDGDTWQSGNLDIDTTLNIRAAAGSIQGGAALFIEAGATGVFSLTVKNDTTALTPNLRVDAGTGQFMRSTAGARKYKDKIKDLELDSSLIYNIRPISFNSKCKGDDKTKRFVGLLAEEIEQIYPSAVEYGDNNELESVDYRTIQMVMLKETQNLNARLSILEGV